jgi:hypothetical protein
MIGILKVFRFTNTKFGEFICSLVFFVGIIILGCGSNLFSWTIALTTHSIFFFIINDILTPRSIKDDYCNEMTAEIEMIRGIIKEKS